MYNIVQISKLESSIKAQKCKTDLLLDITKLHEQHLKKLNEMIKDIRDDIQVKKFQQKFKLSMDRVIVQITSDDHKLQAMVATLNA